MQNYFIYVSALAVKTFCGYNLFFCFIEKSFTEKSHHCAKNVQIGSFLWSVFFRIQSKYGKYGPERTPYLDTFYLVFMYSKHQRAERYFRKILFESQNRHLIGTMELHHGTMRIFSEALANFELFLNRILCWKSQINNNE